MERPLGYEHKDPKDNPEPIIRHVEEPVVSKEPERITRLVETGPDGSIVSVGTPDGHERRVVQEEVPEAIMGGRRIDERLRTMSPQVLLGERDRLRRALQSIESGKKIATELGVGPLEAADEAKIKQDLADVKMILASRAATKEQ